MRHQKAGRTLSRKSGPRRALLSNLTQALIEYERIETTDAKAKEIRGLADRAINWAASLGDILTKDEDKLDAEDKARKLHAMRMARRVVKNPVVLHKLFNEVGPRFVGRPGGFTRIIKKGFRHGDAAPVSIIELVERGEAEAPAAGKKAATEARAE